MASRKKVLVESPEEKRNREMVESIANNIASLSKAVAALLNGPLKKRALIILLSTSAGMSQVAIDQVLGALESMRTDWLK